MIEPEIAFADLADDADLAEDFLKSIFRTLLNERADDMEFFQKRIDKGCLERLEKFIEASFERMDYTDAIARLEKAVADGHKFEFPVKWGMDLQSEHERWLTEEHIGRPVVLMNYPKDIKAFYMRMNDDGKTVAAMDVLAPGIGEIIGGSQREERLDVLDARGTPGNDHIDWKPIVAALKAVRYRGDIVIESFTTDVKVIAAAAAIWRKMEPTREEIATKGLKFLKRAFK